MSLINKLKSLRRKILIKIYSASPIQRNKIILWSNGFKLYGCNPKYITEYILENDPNKFDIVWVINNMVKIPESIPKNVRVVKYFSKEYLYELHTARFVICNAHYFKKV